MFSIVIPYYKKRKYIERCIDAVLAQTFQDFEIILVDDGSQDDVAQLIEEKYSGKVYLIQQENQGVAAARNNGIAAATHDYIAFLDADDYWSVFYLEIINEVIKLESNVTIIGSHFTRNEKNLLTSYENAKYEVLENYFQKQVFINPLFLCSATVISKHFLKNQKGYESSIKIGEDWELLFRVMASSGKAVYINQTAVYYSDEDDAQATKQIHPLKNTILYWVGSTVDLNSISEPLKTFYPIFLRKFLYSYYYDKQNHLEAAKIIGKIGKGNFYSRLLYSLPFSIGVYFVTSPLKKFISYYSTFLVK